MLTAHRRVSRSVAAVMLLATICSLGCDVAETAKTVASMQIVGWGQNNILSKWIEVRPPQSFLVAKVRLPLELVGTEQPDGSVRSHILTRDFTLVRTKSSVGPRDFQPAGAKFDSQDFLEGDVEQTLNFPNDKQPVDIEWIVYFPLTTADASLPSYALRFKDQPLVRIPPNKLESVESLTDPQVIWSEPKKP